MNDKIDEIIEAIKELGSMNEVDCDSYYEKMRKENLIIDKLEELKTKVNACGHPCQHVCKLIRG